MSAAEPLAGSRRKTTVIAQALPNRYYVVPAGAVKPVPWNPKDPNDRPTYDCLYFGGVLAAFDELLDSGGLTVYLTADVKKLPSLGPDVVAVVVSDEAARYPDYAPFIRATFKCYGTDLAGGLSLLRQRDLLGLATSLNFARISAQRFPSALRHSYYRVRCGTSRGRVYPIPLGYFRQADLPLQAIQNRRYDVFFRGSIAQHARHRALASGPFLSPKTRSRIEMIAELQRIAERHPEHRITVEQIPAFFTGSADDALAFSEAMMQTKICIVPRGASFETFRYFEALRYGCVVVAEPLPRRWFYDGAPAITIERWCELEAALLPLLSDPAKMYRKHVESLAWWRTVCGETAVGSYMAANLPH